MSTIAQILSAKADQGVHTIAPGATVFEALQFMAEKNIGALPVVDGGRVVGLLSERNYARRVALAGRSSRDTRVEEIMDRQVGSVAPSQSREECMVLMTARHVRHLVVLEGGSLAGLVSIGDLVKDTLGEQRFLIEQLEHYIAGVRG
jgi:CBS domain-containing protein